MRQNIRQRGSSTTECHLRSFKHTYDTDDYRDNIMNCRFCATLMSSGYTKKILVPNFFVMSPFKLGKKQHLD